jgi:hypothetical protein
MVISPRGQALKPSLRPSVLGLEKAGVDFVAADMPTANRLTVGTMAMVARGRATHDLKRTKEALAVAKKRGRKLGGYRPGAKLTPKPEKPVAQPWLALPREGQAADAVSLRALRGDWTTEASRQRVARARGRQRRSPECLRGGERAQWSSGGKRAGNEVRTACSQSNRTKPMGSLCSGDGSAGGSSYRSHGCRFRVWVSCVIMCSIAGCQLERSSAFI